MPLVSSSPPLFLETLTSHLCFTISQIPCFSLENPGFGRAWVLGESWRTEGKSSGKNVPKNPFHSLPENLLNSWPVHTVFIGLILGTEKRKDRRTPTGLGNSYWGSADSAFVTQPGEARIRTWFLQFLFKDSLLQDLLHSWQMSAHYFINKISSFQLSTLVSPAQPALFLAP